MKDDVDNLEGQALADAVGDEVMGWVRVYNPGPEIYGDDWWDQKTQAYQCPVEDWHPESSGSDFWAVWDKLVKDGRALTLCQSNVSGKATAIVSGSRLVRSSEITRDSRIVPADYEVDEGGCSEDKDPKSAFLRAALKAVRARRGTP